MKKPINHVYLIVLLAILSSVAPIAVDTYIPSIPTMAQDFNVSIEKIELTLPIFLLGFAIGQIFGGVLSDNIGRRKSSLLGLLGFAFFSLLIIFTHDIYLLWAYRFLEAFFGGLIVVNASAAVRDLFHGQEAAKVFSLIGTIRSLAPLLAPALGSFIIHFYSWRAVFIFLTLYSLGMAFFIFKDFKETYTYTKRKALESYKLVLTNHKAMRVMLVLALGFSGMFSLIAKSPFIYIEHYGISTDMFPFFFGFNIVILMLMIRVNIKLLQRYSALFLIKSAVLTQVLIGIGFILFAKDIGLLGAMFFIASFMSLNGFIYGNCTALALENFSKNAGVASSVIGVVQFGLGAIISAVVLMFHSNSLLPIAISITLIAAAAYLLIRNHK